MILTNPPTYVTVAQFRAMASDYDLTLYTDAQILDIVTRASGTADGLMRKSYLAQERTIRYMGDGSNKLNLYERPLLYIKRCQIIVPGTSGLQIPVDQLLIDYDSGSVLEYTPLLYQGQGYFARFPENVPVDFTIAYGYGLAALAPSISSVDGTGAGIPPGTYNLAVTTKTMYGETTATVSTFTTVTGSRVVTITPVLGAYVYRAYISPATNNTTVAAPGNAIGDTVIPVTSTTGFTVGSKWRVDVGSKAEVFTIAAIGTGNVTVTTPALYAHAVFALVIPQPLLCAESPYTTYGGTSLQIAINSLTPPTGIWQDSLPTVDTSAPDIPAALTEAIRLLALDSLYEQNNLANRGVNMTESGRKRVSWRSTEGNSGKGSSFTQQRAEALLRGMSLQAIY